MSFDNRSEGDQKDENGDSDDSEVSQRHRILAYAVAANTSQFNGPELLEEPADAVEDLAGMVVPGFTRGQIDVREYEEHVTANIDMSDVGTGRIGDI